MYVFSHFSAGLPVSFSIDLYCFFIYSDYSLFVGFPHGRYLLQPTGSLYLQRYLLSTR